MLNSILSLLDDRVDVTDIFFPLLTFLPEAEARPRLVSLPRLMLEPTRVTATSKFELPTTHTCHRPLLATNTGHNLPPPATAYRHRLPHPDGIQYRSSGAWENHQHQHLHYPHASLTWQPKLNGYFEIKYFHSICCLSF